jgi:hypothetical protein
MHGLLASCSWRKALVLAAAGVLVGTPWPARAGIIVTVQSVSADAGTTGNALEVDLQNTGSSVDIASFSFEISVAPSSGVTFTGATINTLTNMYIFSGNSAQGPNIATSPPGTTLDASDNAASGSTTVGTNSIFGLGEVFFNLAPSAPAGPVVVTLTPFPFTTLTDPNLNNVPIDTLNTGTITVLPAAATVPEPSALISATLGLMTTACFIWTRSRSARKAVTTKV